MLKRMTSKLNLRGSKPSDPSMPPTPVSASSVSMGDPRGSISTERTSLSSGSKGGESMDVQVQEKTQQHGLPVPCRPRATYKLPDFTILRTLGTGSFGRVHLGSS
jgi:protein kinase A